MSELKIYNVDVNYKITVGAFTEENAIELVSSMLSDHVNSVELGFEDSEITRVKAKCCSDISEVYKEWRSVDIFNEKNIEDLTPKRFFNELDKKANVSLGLLISEMNESGMTKRQICNKLSDALRNLQNEI